VATEVAWAGHAGSVRVDVAIVGAGGAGAGVLVQLAQQRTPAVDPPTVAVVDPVHRTGRDRTWCFWDDGASAVEAAIHRRWTSVLLVDERGVEHRLDLDPLRYVLLRSQDLYALADKAAADLGAVRVDAAATAVLDGAERAVVHTENGPIEARWVLDSRPARPWRPATTALLQHFRGWTVRFAGDVLDPSMPVFMDFTVPSPAAGVAFGYVLPDDTRTGLVEYTEFSRERLPDAAYDEALRRYLAGRWGAAGEPGSYEVDDVEDGAIPMTDAVPLRRVGRRIVRLGTAGGATRASTGYTFAAMQRQAAAVAAALLAGRDPLPPPAYPARHRWMDGVLLHALDRGLVDGPALLSRLLLANPPERVLRFLDGRTSLAEEVRIMRATPTLAMGRATVANALDRTRRRLRGSAA
jgi:lycopene beta-cyclase